MSARDPAASLMGLLRKFPNEQSGAVTVPLWGGAGHSQHFDHAASNMPSETDVIAAFKETAPAVSTAKGKPAQAPKAAEKPIQAPKNKAANPAQGSPNKLQRPQQPNQPHRQKESINPAKPMKSSQKGSDQSKPECREHQAKLPTRVNGWRRPDRYYEPRILLASRILNIMGLP